MSRRKSREIKRRRRIIGYSGLLIVLIIIGAYFYQQKSSEPSSASVSASESKKQEAEKPNKYKAASHGKRSEDPPVNIVNSQDIDRYLKSIHFNGSAMIVKNGKVVIEKGYGLSNREKGINLEESGHFV